MAKALSPLASIIRGSVAGSTFTANQFAQIIIRARTAPVQPGTVNQSKIKAQFTAANSAWHGLTVDQRRAWIDYAATLTYSGPLGTYKVPGRQVFLSNYGTARYLYDRGVLPADPVTTAPTIPGFLAFSDLNIEAPSSTDVGYKITGANPNTESIGVYVMNSIAFDESRYRYKGPFKSDTIFSTTVPPQGDFEVNVIGLNVDSKYFCSVRGIVSDDPIRITPLFYFNIVALASA